MCSGRVSSSCSISGTGHVNLVTNPLISREWGKYGKCLRQVEHIRGHLWHIYSIAVNQVMLTLILPKRTLGSVASVNYLELQNKFLLELKKRTKIKMLHMCL